MTNESILISEVIPATPERIFSAWMDSAEHSAFTGEEATVVPKVGGEHQSAGGYIKGRTLELHEGTRIVQSWRTTEFPPESPDSRVEITLEPTLGGTLVTLLHTDIPVGQGDRYRQGWNEYYLTKLKNYFADTDQSAAPRVTNGADETTEFEVDVDLASEVMDLEPTAETPTKMTGQGAKAKAKAKPPALRAKSAAATAKPTAKAAVKAASKTATKVVKAAVKLAAGARSAVKKVARLALNSQGSKKMKAAKSVKGTAKGKLAAKITGRPAAKPRRAARVAKPAAARGSGKIAAKKTVKTVKKAAGKKPLKKKAKSRR